jgi:hypothetical protein
MVNSADGCSWSSDGTSFCISDPDFFEAHTLPTFFKHSQLSSFIRQLNMYNFSKTEGQLQWTHPKFRRNFAQWLPQIKRKPSSSMKAATAAQVAPAPVASIAAPTTSVAPAASTVRVRLSAVTQAAQPAPPSAATTVSAARLTQQQQRIDALLAERQADHERIEALERNEERMRERLRKSRNIRMRLHSEVQQMTRMLSAMLPPAQYCELKDLFAARDVDELDDELPSKSADYKDDEALDMRKQKKQTFSENAENHGFQLPTSSYPSASTPRYDEFISDFPAITPMAALVPQHATYASLFTPAAAGDLRFESDSGSQAVSSASSPVHQRRRLNESPSLMPQSVPVVMSASALMAQLSHSDASASTHDSDSVSPTSTDCSMPPLDSWSTSLNELSVASQPANADDVGNALSQSQYQWLQLQLANIMFQSSVLPSGGLGNWSNDISKA